jgi:hypothetical protein
MGHSLGGAASAEVARERNDVDAVINLDADLFGEYVDYANGKYVMKVNDLVLKFFNAYLKGEGTFTAGGT